MRLAVTNWITILLFGLDSSDSCPAKICLYLILNTQETSHFYWHQFWDKNDGENICRLNCFRFPRALSELPANWPGLTSLFDWIGQASQQVTLKGRKGLVGSENNFKGIYFHHHFYLKTGVKSKNFLCITWHQKPTVLRDTRNSWGESL